MVEGMKIKVTSFKRPHICTIALSAQPCSRPPPTYVSTRDSWTPMGRSGPASCAGSWCTQGSVCALQESVSPVLCKFWWLYGELMVTSSKRAYAIPRFIALRAPALAAVHC